MSSTRSFQFIDPDRIRGPSIDDITKEMNKGSLRDAYLYFKRNCVNYQPYSVLIFPQITDFKKMNLEYIDFDEYFKTLKEENKDKQDVAPHFQLERLKKLMNGIYTIEDLVMTEECNNTKLEEFIKEKPSINMPKTEEWKYCVGIVEDLFENSGVATYAYMRDILFAPKETGNMLDIFPSHISIGENPEVKEMPGINTSMHYVGEKGSFTPFHIEDGGLSSINLLKAGGPKIWIVIPYQFQAEVEASFVEFMRNNEKSKGKRQKTVICKEILQHKHYLITPKLLTEWKIPYSIVVQRPGDLFFIRTGTYHAVLNMEKNIAEAINFGCDQWTSSYQPVPCNCIENLRREVPQDRRVIISFKKSKKKLYKCEFGCEELFVMKAKLKKHEKLIHKTSFTCAECSAIFNEKNNLIRHLSTYSIQKVKKECQICKRKVLDLKQHNKRIHENLKPCEKCKKKYYANRIKEHTEKCTVVCPVCRINCANKGYLTQHMKHKHSNKL